MFLFSGGREKSVKVGLGTASWRKSNVYML
jgi:hypothetical protein